MLLSEIIIIVLAYLLGSIPFGFLVTYLSAKKNILKIGWRKTSASNVLKNVGLWQGIVSGLSDVGKGTLAVWLAQYFGFSSLIQALAGVGAVAGHNWSCFLKFAGGRGLGTFIGAFLILSPKVLGLSFIPLVILSLIWNGSVGTILFLVTAIFVSFLLGQFNPAGIFVIISLAPIFIKRLSPIKELSLKDWKLIRNRLVFDNDQPRLDLRIKRLIKRPKSP